MCNFLLYSIKSGITGQRVSLIIYVLTNFSFSLQLSEIHFIDLSKTLNFILISGAVCQEPGVNHGHIPVRCNISKSPFSLNKTKLSFENNVNFY